MDSDRFVVRVARLADDRALAVLDAEAWPPQLWVTPPQDRSEPFFSARRIPEDVLIAASDDVIVGYARIGRHMSVAANEHVLHFHALAVSPHARGQGVGSILIRALIEEARSRGARKLGLRVLSTNTRAVHLYEKHGFEPEGRLRDEIRLPDGSYADDLWYALRLDPNAPADPGHRLDGP